MAAPSRAELLLGGRLEGAPAAPAARRRAAAGAAPLADRAAALNSNKEVTVTCIASHPRLHCRAALALLLSACAATTPQADARFGQSVRATLASQIAHPAAARNANPVHGIDGRARAPAQRELRAAFAAA